MATLYELTEEYRQLLEMMEDDTVDPEVLQDTLSSMLVLLTEICLTHRKWIRQPRKCLHQRPENTIVLLQYRRSSKNV